MQTIRDARSVRIGARACVRMCGLSNSRQPKSYTRLFLLLSFFWFFIFSREFFIRTEVADYRRSAIIIIIIIN